MIPVNDLRSRLVRCFNAVFSESNEQKLTTANLDMLQGWDSVAAVTLVSTIEEEFQKELDLDALGSRPSFQSILEYLRRESNA
jgi:acyl carrier protein